jgi:hypothetical protein
LISYKGFPNTVTTVTNEIQSVKQAKSGQILAYEKQGQKVSALKLIEKNNTNFYSSYRNIIQQIGGIYF